MTINRMTIPSLSLAAVLMGAFVLSAHAQTEHEADTALATQAAPGASNPSNVGRWTQHWFADKEKFSPMSVANLPNGQVLLWSGNLPYGFTNGTGKEKNLNTYYAILDTTGRKPVVSYGSFTNKLGEMFCTGTTMLTDGSILLTGGSQVESSIWIRQLPKGGVTFEKGPELNQGRSYNSTTLLTDGSVFTIGGSFKTVQADNGRTLRAASPGGERLMYAAPQWSNLSGIPGKKIAEEWNPKNRTWQSPDVQLAYRSDNHAWLIPFETNSGAEKVFHAGPIRHMHVIDFVGNGNITAVAKDRPLGYRMSGSVARISPFHLLITGGAASYGDTRGGLNISAKARFPAYKDRNDYPKEWDKRFVAKSEALWVDMSGLPTGRDPLVKVLSARPSARVFATSVVLPGGDVLITGGQSKAEVFTDNKAVFKAELYSEGVFKEVASPTAARTYHSAGILLPNATVLMVGGGACDVRSGSDKCGLLNENFLLPGEVHRDYEIYEPPYLHKGGKRPGAPAVRSAQRDGDIDVVGVPRGGKASEWFTATSQNCNPGCRMELIRHVSVTHGVNNDQLRVPLTRHPSKTDMWRVPDDAAKFVLGGHYMLFAINNKGVPSFGATVRVEKK
jgi:galactose oxidase